MTISFHTVDGKEAIPPQPFDRAPLPGETLIWASGNYRVLPEPLKWERRETRWVAVAQVEQIGDGRKAARQEKQVVCG